MSSGTRRLNFTQRRRIKRDHAQIKLRDCKDGDRKTFDVALDLAKYGLPPDARVIVEAYRQTAFQRFDFGTVGRPDPPDTRLPNEFGVGEGVQFRVKVVEGANGNGSPSATSGVRRARILAHADRITPIQAGRRRSLLPLDRSDSRDEVWRLEVDLQTGPLLRISVHLVANREAFVRSREFTTLVLPQVFRCILASVFEDGIPDEESAVWRLKWAGLACSTMRATQPPPAIGEDQQAREEWIDEVVSKWCRGRRLGTLFQNWWGEGGAK